MTMKVGNGATAAQAYDVFVGEVFVAGNVVSTLTWYAVQGRYIGAEFGFATTTQYTQTHNLGGNPQFMKTRLQAVNKTTDAGWAVGARVDVTTAGFDYQNGYGVVVGLNAATSTANCVSANVITAANLQILNKTAGTNGAITTANWKLLLQVDRGW